MERAYWFYLLFKAKSVFIKGLKGSSRFANGCLCCVCVYDLQLIEAGKGEAIRIRAILRSLVPREDLEGIINIPFSLPLVNTGVYECVHLLTCELA